MQILISHINIYSEHPFAQRSALDRRELKNEAILYMTPSSTVDSFGDSHFMDLYKEAGYQPNILFRSNDVRVFL